MGTIAREFAFFRPFLLLRVALGNRWLFDLRPMSSERAISIDDAAADLSNSRKVVGKSTVNG